MWLVTITRGVDVDGRFGEPVYVQALACVCGGGRDEVVLSVDCGVGKCISQVAT